MAYMKDKNGRRLDDLVVATETDTTADTLLVVGNSIAEGSGAPAGMSLAAITARALNMREENYAVAGSVVQSGTTLLGLYNRVLTKLYPPAAPPLGHVASAALVLTGVNDLYGGPQFTDGYRVVDYIVRAVIHRLRALATIPVTDPMIAFAKASDGTVWAAVTSPQYFSGIVPTQATPNPTGVVRQTLANGDTYKITLPSWWPAGRPLEVWGHNIGSSSSFNGGAVHSWVKTGGASGSYDSRGRVTNGIIAPWHYVIPNCQPGDVIDVTISGQTTNGDYVTNLQLPSDDPPPVVLAGVYKNPEYGTGTHNPVDADVDTLNALFMAAAASFADGRVRYVNTDSIIAKNPTLYAVESPRVHPNIAGHRKLAVEGIVPAFRDIMPSSTVRARSRRQSRAAQRVDVVRNFDVHDSIGIGTLVAGSAVISSRAIISADSLVFVTPIGAGSGVLSRGSVTPTSAGTAGTAAIASSDPSDTRQFQWWVVNPIRPV